MQYSNWVFKEIILCSFETHVYTNLNILKTFTIKIDFSYILNDRFKFGSTWQQLENISARKKPAKLQPI